MRIGTSKFLFFLHYLRSLARDLGSEHWGPTTDAGFEIQPSGQNDFKISAGHYYVQGLLCENEQPLAYADQPDYHSRKGKN